LEIWLEILQSIERIELAEKLSFTNRLVQAAAHIRLHEEGEHVLGHLRFQRQQNLEYSQKNDKSCAELFKLESIIKRQKCQSLIMICLKMSSISGTLK
jgi:hypothetical protein